MLKLALLITLLVLAACKDHHGHGPTPAWMMEVTIGEEGPVRTTQIYMDDYLAAIPYSAVNFQALAPVEKGHHIERSFALFSEGEQRVLTTVKCDTKKEGVAGPAGEATLALLGTKVKFYCAF